MHSLWMLGSGLAFALMGVCVKIAAPHFTAAELVFWRSATSVAVSAFILARMGLALRTRHLGMHMHRGTAGFASMFMFFYALTELPLATATTLNYTSPLFVAILFSMLSRERMRWPLVVALLAGFAGAILLLRPSMEAAQLWPALIGLASGAMAAVAFWNVRKLVDAEEPEERVVFYFALCCLAGSFVWMVPQPWHRIDATNAWPLAGAAVFGTTGQICLTRAYGRGNPLVAATLSYSGIVFAAMLGLAVFGDMLPTEAWIGIVLIVGAGLAALKVRAPAGVRAVPDPAVSD